jgi:dipeptidyl-peptidase-4
MWQAGLLTLPAATLPPCPLNLFKSTLTIRAATADSNGLAANSPPLESTLTEIPGGGVAILPCPNAPPRSPVAKPQSRFETAGACIHRAPRCLDATPFPLHHLSGRLHASPSGSPQFASEDSSMTAVPAQHSTLRSRTALFQLALLLLLGFSSSAVRAQARPETPELFRRLFNSEDFEPKFFGPARWLDGGESYTTVEPSPEFPKSRDIVRYVTASGVRTLLVKASQLIPPGAKDPIAIQNYAWSVDKSKLLIYTNGKQIWRAPTRGDYWVLDQKSGALKKLGGDATPSTLQFAKFSPDATKAAYVRANNIYVEDLVSGAITQLTHDGSDTLVNGTSDWVYEEELFLRDCFRWSPDSKQIAYWQFDTTGVGIFPLIYNLGAPREIVTGFPYPGIGHYPSRLDIPYPIPGTTNSAVRVGVISAAGGDTRWLAVPGNPRDNYIARMEWIPDSSELIVEHLNRLQNTNDVLIASASSGEAKSVFQDQDPAWVDIVDSFRWLPGGHDFLWISERDGWRHIFRVSRDGKNVGLISKGNFDVINLEGVDAKNGLIYYAASPENATQQYLYRSRIDGSGEAERVTPASAPGSHNYDISPDGKWAFHVYSTSEIPPNNDLVQLPTHTSVRMLVENSALHTTAQPLLTAAPMEFFKLDIGDGVTVDGWIIKPANLDPHKKYPLLVHVYGEPAAQTVIDAWGSGDFFHRALVQEGYIVASFDTRGTPAPKGRAWRKQVYGAIHPVIVHDQTAAVQALLRARPYLDPSRVAVWGWSGGGSSTLSLMFRSPDVYKVGMAVAPVPDLRLYDTIYQERYMGLPQQNVEGYKNSSAINFAEGLKGKLLIVHGSGDDNVHYSGTEMLLNRLIELNKPVDFMEYPNRTHAISEGEGTTLHLFSLLRRYLEEHLPPGPVAP